MIEKTVFLGRGVSLPSGVTTVDVGHNHKELILPIKQPMFILYEPRSTIASWGVRLCHSLVVDPGQEFIQCLHAVKRSELAYPQLSLISTEDVAA